MTKRTVEVQTEPFECVPHWMLFEVDISANALRVYLILRKYRDYVTSECHPSRKTIAKLAGGIAVSTLDRALSELVAIDAIAIEKRYRDEEDGGGQTSNRYRVYWDRGGAVSTSEDPPTSPVNSPPTENWYTNEDPSNQDPDKQDPRNKELEHFNEFWAAYPRKKGKGQARTAWARAVKKADPAVIVYAAVQFRQWCEQDGTENQFIPHASTWLNGERWTDERDPQPLSKPEARRQAHLALIHKIAENEGYRTNPELEAGS